MWKPAGGSRPPLPAPLAYGAFEQVDGGMEIYGGSDGQHVYRECWRLERGQTAWAAAGKLPSDSLLGRAVYVNGRLLLLGGCSEVVDLTHCSDTAQVREKGGDWHKIPASGLSSFAAVAVRERVYPVRRLFDARSK